MPAIPPDLHLGKHTPDESQLASLLDAARKCFARKDVRKAADALCAAQALAHHAGLHRQAAELRKAITILGSGGKPKLLTRIPPANRL